MKKGPTKKSKRHDIVEMSNLSVIKLRSRLEFLDKDMSLAIIEKYRNSIIRYISAKLNPSEYKTGDENDIEKNILTAIHLDDISNLETILSNEKNRSIIKELAQKLLMISSTLRDKAFIKILGTVDKLHPASIYKLILNPIWVYISMGHTKMIDHIYDILEKRIDKEKTEIFQDNFYFLLVLGGSPEKLQEETERLKHNLYDKYYLHLAASRRDKHAKTTVKTILSLNHINSKIKDNGFTPLHLASSTSSPEMIDFLIKEGADINAESKAGTPLEYAIENRMYKNVEALLKYEQKPIKGKLLPNDIKNDNILVYNLDENTICDMPSLGIDIINQIAIPRRKENATKTIEAIIASQHEQETTKDFFDLTVYSILNRKIEISKMFLDKIKVKKLSNKRKNTLVYAAINGGKMEVLLYLLKHEFDLNETTTQVATEFSTKENSYYTDFFSPEQPFAIKALENLAHLFEIKHIKTSDCLAVAKKNPRDNNKP